LFVSHQVLQQDAVSEYSSSNHLNKVKCGPSLEIDYDRCLLTIYPAELKSHSLCDVILVM